MKYKIQPTTRFKKDMKLIHKRGYDIRLLENVVDLLALGLELPYRYRDHQLTGNLAGHRECHITPDWLLIYKIEEDALILELMRTGTHSDLLK